MLSSPRSVPIRRRKPPKIAGTPSLIAGGDTRGPDFICIGAQKGGTRWLFDQLDLHPDFWMPPVKELHYLNESRRFLKVAIPLYRKVKADLEAHNAKRQRLYERPLDDVDIAWMEARFKLVGRPVDLDDYARLFSPRGNRLSGDICPPYAIVPDDRASAVRRRFPDAKLIYIARDPIERLWSQYCMVVARGHSPDAGGLEAVKRFVAEGNATRHSAIREVLARWRIEPGDPNCALFFFDDLKRDSGDLRRRILSFLGADPNRGSGAIPPGYNRKSAGAKIEMSGPVRAFLISILADEVTGCAGALGGPAALWPQRYGL